MAGFSSPGTAFASGDKRSAAVEAARARRTASSAERAVRTEWLIEQVSTFIKMKVKARVRLAAEYVKNRVIVNISRPVTKTVVARPSGKRWITETLVSNRSRPGEFPKADTTLLMKTIFTDYAQTGSVYDGFIGTPLQYGLELELVMNRSFLLRTFYEEYGTIRRILTGPIQ